MPIYKCTSDEDFKQEHCDLEVNKVLNYKKKKPADEMEKIYTEMADIRSAYWPEWDFRDEEWKDTEDLEVGEAKLHVPFGLFSKVKPVWTEITVRPAVKSTRKTVNVKDLFRAARDHLKENKDKIADGYLIKQIDRMDDLNGKHYCFLVRFAESDFYDDED